MNKYHAQKAVFNGITFDSRKEANRYAELLIMQRAGLISNLGQQRKFILIPTQKDEKGKLIEKECSYVCDFIYTDTETGETVVEDVKGYRDTSSAAYAKFIIKRKLMLERYGIRVKEV